jgi:hypothetical protein
MATPTTIKRAQKKRSPSAKQQEALPQYLPRATEFSDDPDLTNGLEVMKAIKRELTGGQGPLGSLWDDVREATSLEKPGGRPRDKGDWALAYTAGYVLSRQSEMVSFHNSVGAPLLFKEAEFEKTPSYQSMYLRFTELEIEQCVRALDDAADKLIQHARSKEPRIGKEVFIDGSSIHSRARLHHDCPDKKSCAAAGGVPAEMLAVAEVNEVEDARHAETDDPPDETERIHPSALREAEDQEGRYPHYKMVGGHRYGLLDPDAGARKYSKGKSKKGSGKFWVGGLDVVAVDGFTRGMLGNVVISADKPEFKAYFALERKLERTLGESPEIVSLDRGHSVERVYRRNTYRGIGSAIDFRRPNWKLEDRQDLRSEQADEHGYARCQFCGGPCTQIGPRLGLHFTPAGHPRFKVRCISPNTVDCLNKVQTVDPAEVPYGWRLLLPIPRESERYHATRQRHKNFESIFHHVRQRYRVIGSDETGKLKRFGLAAHRLRIAAARFLEWFRICLRHGWLGKHAKLNKSAVLTVRGDRRLRSQLLSRRQRGINLPYGSIAYLMGLAPSPDLPAQCIPPSKKKNKKKNE